MKAKITRPDGTIVDVEGTSEEIERLLVLPAPIVYVPYYVPTAQPAIPNIPWYVETTC